MGFAGYVAVCVQLYCRGKLSLFHTTFFGLNGHLQVWNVITLMFLKEPASLVFSVSCTWLHFCTFPSVGWVKYEVLFIIIYYLCYFDCYGTYVFYLHVFSCSIFSKHVL
jgi:hypothetical protein